MRRKSCYISETFRRKDDARAWALGAERQIDRGEAPEGSRTARLRTFGDLIDLHTEDIKEVGRAPGRSKDATLAMLKRDLGGTQHGRAGPRPDYPETGVVARLGGIESGVMANLKNLALRAISRNALNP